LKKKAAVEVFTLNQHTRAVSRKHPVCAAAPAFFLKRAESRIFSRAVVLSTVRSRLSL
jgi:hypothetical protein